MNLEKIRHILPNRIRILRSSRGWTQERLAEAVDIHPTYISRIESGRKIPTLQMICKIADVFGTDVYELFVDELKMQSSDYKKKKLINILHETKPATIDIYTALLNVLQSRYKKEGKSP